MLVSGAMNPVQAPGLVIRGAQLASAPSAGPPPWHLFRFTFHTIVGLATADPNGATRWRSDR
jgi:hypothetical protein